MRINIRRTIYTIFLALALAASALAGAPADYYDGTEGLTDQALIVKLREIITGGHTWSGSWTTNRNKMYEFHTFDGDKIKDPYSQLVFTGTSEMSGEHVWPRSHGAEDPPAEIDIHHLLPVEGPVNSARNHYPFYYVDENDNTFERECARAKEVTPDIGFFEPCDAGKGDAARAIFYFATRYNLPLVNSTTPIPTGTNAMGYEDVLRVWHVLDPVDDFERNRNDDVFAYQGNRNPYIDHPEFIDSISTFGDPSDTPTPTPTPTPSPTPSGEFVDLSGWTLHQFDSSQSVTFPEGTILEAGHFLIVARGDTLSDDYPQATFEAAWGHTLPANAVYFDAHGQCPQINGDEEFELRDDQGAVAGVRTATGDISLSRQTAVRDATNVNTWTVVDFADSGPASTAWPMNNAGIVITKFGEPSDFNAEFVEIFYDYISPTPTPTPTPTPYPMGLMVN